MTSRSFPPLLCTDRPGGLSLSRNIPQCPGRLAEGFERSWHGAYRDVMEKALDLKSQKLGLGPNSPTYNVFHFWLIKQPFH